MSTFASSAAIVLSKRLPALFQITPFLLKKEKRPDQSDLCQLSKMTVQFQCERESDASTHKMISGFMRTVQLHMELSLAESISLIELPVFL